MIPRRSITSIISGCLFSSPRTSPSLPSILRSASLRHPLSSSSSSSYQSYSIHRPLSTTPIPSAPSPKQKTKAAPKFDMNVFPPERIRNFSVIAHIDHGKSTLSDRLLELTGTIEVGEAGSNKQVLDKLKVERDRGITVKAQTVSMIHTYKGEKYLLNLIDTPGHVDFSYEVSRSLAACEGALLLVDATQGIQAQTISVHGIAKQAGLNMIGIMNKIDLPTSSPSTTASQISSLFGLDPSSLFSISAKTGANVPAVLDAIVERVPPPRGTGEQKMRGLVIDSEYDRFRGVVSLVAVREGTLRLGDKIASSHSGRKYEVLDCGILHPTETPTAFLSAGQVGYVVCNMKTSAEATVGDTFHTVGDTVEALPGFKQTQPMVFAGIYPLDANEFPKLEESISRLILSDRSVTVQRETSNALGQGMRLGFLGTLHLDVFRQRLEDEYDSEVIVTSPSVPRKLVYNDGTEKIIENPADFPADAGRNSNVDCIEEPHVIATIIVPEDFVGPMIQLCTEHRGEQLEYTYLDESSSASSLSLSSSASPDSSGQKSSVSNVRAMLKYQIPMAEIVTDFFDKLKSLSSGYASLDYEDAGWLETDSVKMSMSINGNPIDALAMIVHRADSQTLGKTWVTKLRGVLPRQQYEMSIQAFVGSKCVASEKISAVRKDVTAGLYGGHYERKLKHLNKQKEGKKRLKKMAGNIELPQEAFYDILKSK